MHRLRGHDVPRLMRIQHKYGPTLQAGRSDLNLPDACIAVLDRRRKLPRLKRRPHTLPFAVRHASVKHEGFGAPADPAEQRADDDLICGRRRKRLRADLPS